MHSFTNSKYYSWLNFHKSNAEVTAIKQIIPGHFALTQIPIVFFILHSILKKKGAKSGLDLHRCTTMITF